MRIVFMGFQTWGHVTLEALLASKRHHVSLVVTHFQSHHPYEVIWADSVEELAESAGIRVIRARHAHHPEVAEQIAAARADVIVCSDWRTWVSPEILALAVHGGINVHDGMLPRYGGFAPINWAVANGEVEAGVTAHVMTRDLDLGDIVVQRRVPIGFTDTATHVVQRVFPLLGAVTLEALDLLVDEAFVPARQDRSQATFFHKRTERESEIDWRQSNVDIYNLIRAQSDPYPNAFTLHAGRRLSIKRASLPGLAYRGTPGRVFCRAEGGVVVVCGWQGNAGQGLVLERVQPEGGEEMAAPQYFTRMAEYLG
jgi:methionyl-tRNA formyltransferase